MAAAPPPAPAFPPLDNSLGAFLVGTFLTIYLAGITSIQTYWYFTWFGWNDRKLLRGVVSFLVVIDLFHTAISCYTIYLWTVTHYGNRAILAKCPWSFTWDPFLTGLVAIIVQTFYAWRVFVVSRRKWYIPAAICLLSLLQFAFAIGSTWSIYRLDSQFSRFGEFRYGVAIWLLSAAIADIIITSSLIAYLRSASHSDYQRTSPIVERIIRITIETNGLTCIFAIIDAVLFVGMPQDSWHVIPNLSLVKLYFNSVLVSLNSRKSHRQQSLRRSERTDTPNGTPARRYTAKFGSVSNPNAGPHNELATLSISPAYKVSKVVEKPAYRKSKVDEEEALEPRQFQVCAYNASTRDPDDSIAIPMHPVAPPAPVRAAGSHPSTSKMREYGLRTGAVCEEW